MTKMIRRKPDCSFLLSVIRVVLGKSTCGNNTMTYQTPAICQVLPSEEADYFNKMGWKPYCLQSTFITLPCVFLENKASDIV